jgi:hypothetical protein
LLSQSVNSGLSSNPIQPKKKYTYLGLKKKLNGKMSAQHMQSPGFYSPTLLNQIIIIIIIIKITVINATSAIS